MSGTPIASVTVSLGLVDAAPAPVPVPVPAPAAAAPTPGPTPPKSLELQALLAHQAQIKDWTVKVNKRIYELEEQYLEETTLGNIVKGWDQDAKPQQQKKVFVDDRDRLFSNSSIRDADAPGKGRGGGGVGGYVLPVGRDRFKR